MADVQPRQGERQALPLTALYASGAPRGVGSGALPGAPGSLAQPPLPGDHAPMNRSVALILLSFAACAGPVATVHPEPEVDDRPLVGRWRDPESSTVFEIALMHGKAQVISAVDSNDGEVYEVTESGHLDGRFRWTMHVPSTGYRTTYSVKAVQPDALVTDWQGTGGAGVETLERQR